MSIRCGKERCDLESFQESDRYMNSDLNFYVACCIHEKKDLWSVVVRKHVDIHEKKVHTVDLMGQPSRGYQWK